MYLKNKKTKMYKEAFILFINKNNYFLMFFLIYQKMRMGE